LLYCIRGTLHTPLNALDLTRGKAVKDTMLTSPRLARPDLPPGNRVLAEAAWERQIQQEARHSLLKLRDFLGEKMKSKGGRL
jgi:hypothetical protein